MSRFLIALFVCCSVQLYGQDVDSLQLVIKSTDDLVAKADAYKSILNKLRSTDSIGFKQYLAEGLTFAREHIPHPFGATPGRHDSQPKPRGQKY